MASFAFALTAYILIKYVLAPLSYAEYSLVRNAAGLVLGLSVFASFSLALGLFCPFLMSFIAIETRPNGQYGFCQSNWLGRKLAAQYSRHEGKKGFCQLYVWLSACGAAALYVIALLTMLLWIGLHVPTEEIALAVPSFSEGLWGTIILALGMFGLFGLVLTVKQVTRRYLSGTAVERIHAETVCPTIQTD